MEEQNYTEPRQTVTIDGVVYYRDSLGEENERTLKNILIVQEELTKAQRQVDIIQIAKEALVTQLAQNTDKFEKVQIPQPEVQVTVEKQEEK